MESEKWGSGLELWIFQSFNLLLEVFVDERFLLASVFPA